MANFIIGKSLAEDVENGFEEARPFIKLFLGSDVESAILRNWGEHLILRASSFLQCDTEEDFFGTPGRIQKTLTKLAKAPPRPDKDVDEDDEEATNEEEPVPDKINIIKVLTGFHPRHRAIIGSSARTLAVAKFLIILTFLKKKMVEDWNSLLPLEKSLDEDLPKYLVAAKDTTDVPLAELYGKIILQHHFLPELTFEDNIFPGESFVIWLKNLEKERKQVHTKTFNYIKRDFPVHKDVLKVIFVTIWRLMQVQDEKSKFLKFLKGALTECNQEFTTLSNASNYNVVRNTSSLDDFVDITDNIYTVFEAQGMEPPLQLVQDAFTSLVSSILKTNTYLVIASLKELGNQGSGRCLKVDVSKDVAKLINKRKDLITRIADQTTDYKNPATLGISTDICQVSENIFLMNIQGDFINVPETSDFVLMLSSFSPKIVHHTFLQDAILRDLFGIYPAKIYPSKGAMHLVANAVRQTVKNCVGVFLNDIAKIYFESQLSLAKLGWHLELAKKSLNKIFRNPIVGFSRLESTHLRIIALVTGDKSTKKIYKVLMAVHYRNSTIHPCSESLSTINFAPLFQTILDIPLSKRENLDKTSETLAAKLFEYLAQFKISCVGIGGSDWASDELETAFKKLFEMSELKVDPKIRCFTSESCGLFSLIASLAPPSSNGDLGQEFFRISTGISIAVEWGALGVALEAVQLETKDGENFTLEELDPACGRNYLPEAEKDAGLLVKLGLLCDHFKRCDLDANTLKSYPVCPVLCYVLDISTKRSISLYALAKDAEQDRLNQEIWMEKLKKGSRNLPCPFTLTLDIPSTLKVPGTVTAGLSVGEILLECLVELNLDDTSMFKDAIKTLKLGKGWLKQNRERMYMSQIRVLSKEGVILDGMEYLALRALFPVPSTVWNKVIETVLTELSDVTITGITSAAVVKLVKDIKPEQVLRTTWILGILGIILASTFKHLTPYAEALDKALREMKEFQITLPSAYFAGVQRSPTQDSSMESKMLFSTDTPSLSSRFLSTVAFRYKHVIDLKHSSNLPSVQRLTDQSRFAKLNSILPPGRFWNQLTLEDIVAYSDHIDSRVQEIDDETAILTSAEAYDIPKTERNKTDERSQLLDRRYRTHPKLSFALTEFSTIFKSGWAACNGYRDHAYKNQTIFDRKRKLHLDLQQFRLPFTFLTFQLEVENDNIQHFNQKSYFEVLRKLRFNPRLQSRMNQLNKERNTLIQEINNSLAKQKIKKLLFKPEDVVLIPESLYKLRPISPRFIRVMAHETTDLQPFHMTIAALKIMGRSNKDEKTPAPKATAGKRGRGGYQGGDKKPDGGNESGFSTDSEEDDDQKKSQVIVPGAVVAKEIEASGSNVIKIIQGRPCTPVPRSLSVAPKTRTNPCQKAIRPSSASSKPSYPCQKAARPFSPSCKPAQAGARPLGANTIKKTCPSQFGSGSARGALFVNARPVSAPLKKEITSLPKPVKVIKNSPSFVLGRGIAKVNRQLAKRSQQCPKLGTKLDFVEKENSLESLRSSSSRINLQRAESNQTTPQECINLPFEYDIFSKRR